MMNINKNHPKYKNTLCQKITNFCRYYAGWNCQNPQGHQKHKMTLLDNSYKVSLK